MLLGQCCSRKFLWKPKTRSGALAQLLNTI
jgi:hypothetical protein